MKNYVITGSIGHISKPIIQGLVKAGKNVSVITSNPANKKEIENLGAKALVGSLYDEAFVLESFRNAEVVYTMVPPIWQTDNWRRSQDTVSSHYVKAIKKNNVKYVVNLSSIGAHLSEGCGPVNAIHYLEQELNHIQGLNVKHLRPAYFYYNLLSLIPLVKHAGILGSNFGNARIPMIHTRDIAAIALEELLNLNFKGNSVRHIVGDERTGTEIAAVLSKAIGKNVPWVDFTDEQQLKGLLDGGVPATHAPAFVEMGVALRNGTMQEKVVAEKPALSPTKLEDFAKEFAEAFEKA